MAWTVKTICNKLKLEFSGEDLAVVDASSLNKSKSEGITFLKNKKVKLPNQYDNKTFVVPVGYGIAPSGAAYIYSENPKITFSDILELLYPGATPNGLIQVGQGTIIEDGASIGANTLIGSNCVVKSCVSIGANCVIKSGTIIGEDGFGFEYTQTGIPVQIRHIAGVKIGDNVNIGSNCTIDRGMLDDTEIWNNVKIDNLVHIGHNCVVKDNVIITACAELSGGVVLNTGAWVAPNASILQRVDIGVGAVVGIGASVIKDVKAQERVSGIPAMLLRELVKIKGSK